MTAIALALAFSVSNPYMELFTQAAHAYESGDYIRAIQKYEQLVREDVVDAAVFYNLGNSYYRAGHLGPAIANYERTLQLKPNHQPAHENLARAIREIPRNLGRPQPSEWEASLLFWHYGLSTQAAITLAVVSWWMLWLLLALRAWRPVPYIRGAAVAMAVLSGAFAASAWYKLNPVLIAVASEEVVPVRYLPEDDEAVRFELYEGDRVRIEDKRQPWYLIETASGERGWAHTSAVTVVGPPYTPFPGLSSLEAQPMASLEATP
jgi:tetratricopeptide (TPR) repeat protein